MNTSRFDSDTAVRRNGPGAYSAILSAGWSVGDRPNGGYLLAVAARALSDALQRPDPLSLTAHYAVAPVAGEASLDVDVLRVGRRIASGQASLRQGGRRRLVVLGAFGDLEVGGYDDTGSGATQPGEGSGTRGSSSGLPTGLVVPGDVPPALPDPDHCRPASGRTPDGMVLPLVGQFDMRLHPDTAGWARGTPTGRAEVGGWIRLADGRAPDPYLLPLVVDSFPPTVFDLGYQGWIPTAELTVHVRARPVAGWLRCWIRSRLVASGFVEEDAEVWDDAGQLVAMSRQLAVLPAERPA